MIRSRVNYEEFGDSEKEEPEENEENHCGRKENEEHSRRKENEEAYSKGEESEERSKGEGNEDFKGKADSKEAFSEKNNNRKY